jgi:chromosome segregation ATPase
MLFICAGAIIGSSIVLGKSVRGSAIETQGELEQRVSNCDHVLGDVEKRARIMVSADKLTSATSRLSELEQQIKSTREEFLSIENELSQLQGDVNLKEVKHQEIKKGRDKCAKLADEIRSNKEQLTSEQQRLEGQLAASKAQLASLEGEVSLTSEQKSALDEINATVDSLAQRLKEAAEVYEQTTKSFLTLENQYNELEKEYRRLIERELSGEGVGAS